MSMNMVSWIITAAMVVPVIIFSLVFGHSSNKKMSEAEQQERIQTNTLGFGILAVALLLF